MHLDDAISALVLNPQYEASYRESSREGDLDETLKREGMARVPHPVHLKTAQLITLMSFTDLYIV